MRSILTLFAYQKLVCAVGVLIGWLYFYSIRKRCGCVENMLVSETCSLGGGAF